METASNLFNPFSGLLAAALADAPEWNDGRSSPTKKNTSSSTHLAKTSMLLDIKGEISTQPPAEVKPSPYGLRQRPPKKINGIIGSSATATPAPATRYKRKAEEEAVKTPPAKRIKVAAPKSDDYVYDDDSDDYDEPVEPSGDLDTPNKFADSFSSDDDDDDDDLGEEARAVREVHNMCRHHMKTVTPQLAKARWDAAIAGMTKDEKIFLKFVTKRGKLETCIQQYGGIFEAAKEMSEHDPSDPATATWQKKQQRKQHCGAKELDTLLDVVNRVIDEQIAKYFPQVPPRDAVVAAIRSNLPRAMSKRITAGWLTKFIRGDICSGLGQRDFTFRLSRRGRKQRPHNQDALEEVVLINMAVERASLRSDKYRFPRISKETKANLLGAKYRIAVSTIKNNLRNLPGKLIQQAKADNSL
eukprot:TRINITY_DN2738_c0_g1_i2.p1 TRINITY_DN2738_c0_g1~~TRINITY_DN2738_c0_g1_i2.p1  ORF type:complete len:415 (-),score=107.53 TRINITY_DN2738_c0_g1_i2:20-1264(-)